MTRTVIFTLALVAAALYSFDPAAAQATRTWVSGVGDDVNPCSRTAPCKTFAGAISKTAAGGEINCLDPGGFGTLTITKSITIDCTGTFRKHTEFRGHPMAFENKDSAGGLLPRKVQKSFLTRAVSYKRGAWILPPGVWNGHSVFLLPGRPLRGLKKVFSSKTKRRGNRGSTLCPRAGG